MIFRSPHPDVSIPEVPLTAFVLRDAKKRGNKPALIDGVSGRAITYADLVASVYRVAGSLAQRGLCKGDVFAICTPNVLEYPIVFHAVALIGGVILPINPLLTTDEWLAQIRNTKAKYLLTTPDFLEKAQEVSRKENLREIFVLGEAPGATSFATLLQEGTQPPDVHINPREDVVALPYSSGTTGLPKGVMRTHYSVVANMRQVESVEPILEDERFIGVLPFFHIYGLMVILNFGLYRGATTVLMPRFDFEQFLRIIQDYRITRAYLVPPIVVLLAKHPLVDKYDLSSVRTIIAGAAPLDEMTMGACSKRLSCFVKQAYGMTEVGPATHINPETVEGNKFPSVGPCVPNTECKIVDINSDQELGVNQTGEIWIRGPQIMEGYLNQPEATRHTIDAEGWLHTGDIGYADEEGYFYIVDRLKELIKYKALQVAPAELEAILLSHPGISDAAVIPSPDEEAGEVPKAFVVLKGNPRMILTADEIQRYVAARVAPHKKIRKVEFINQIPRSPSGKILRRVLVERERSTQG